MSTLTFSINTLCVSGSSRQDGDKITINVGNEQWIAVCSMAEINLRSRVAPTELDAIRDLLICMGANDQSRAVGDDAKVAIALSLTGSTASELTQRLTPELPETTGK